MADLNDNIEKLYRALEKEGFEDIGTPEEFREYVGDSANISNLHKALAGAGYDDIGSEKEFSDWLNEGKQAETAVPQQQTQQPAAQQTVHEPAANEYPQPYDANGNVLTHNGQPYSQEVLRRYYSPENKEGNFRDLATIADQVDNERSVSRMQTTGDAGYVPPQQFSIAPEQQQPAAQRSVSKEDAERFATETQTPLRPKPYVDQPFKEKAEELQQMSKAPNLSQGWANLTAEEQRIIADPNKDFGQKMQAMQDAQTVENARHMNRKEYDSNNFEKFYDEHVSPVFTEERKAGEKKAQEEIDSLPKDTGGGLLSKAIQTVKSDIATERHTDPEKIANQTLKRVEGDDSFGNYILNRMGINGNGSDEGDSPQLTEAEKEMMKALFSKETGEVAGQIIDRMYETYRKENAPKDVLHYITGKAFQENLMSQLYQSMITRVANSSGMRQQLRQMAYEEFGKDQSWWTRVAGGAAPFAVDMIAGGFALPNVVGQAVVKGGVGLAAKEVTQQMAQRAAARGLEGAALKEAVSGAAGVAERYLATQAPIVNLAIRAAGSAANFATYDVQSEIVRQIASGEFKPVDLMKAAAHGAVLGGAMGTVGGAIGRATRNASLAGKVAGNAAGVGAETALFGISSGLQKAIDDGIDIQDVDWADTTGEAFGTVVGMKAVGAAMHPKEFLNRYRKSKDYDLQLNQRDLDELKAAGYDFDGLFKGLGKFGEVAPEKANITRDAEEVGKPGKSAKVEEAYVDQEAYKNILQNPEVSSNTKRKLVYVATGVILKPEPVFGATMDVDDNGHATITTLNAYGNPIETKDYKTEEEAQKEYKNLQEISQTNTIGGLERIAKEANMPYVVDEAKGRTKNETGVDVDDLDQLSSLDEDHLNMVMDAYVKNLQESYMEGFNAKLKRIEQQATEAPKQTDGGEAIREGYSPITQGYSEIREGYSEGNPPSDGGEPPAGTAGGGTGTQAGSSGTPATRSERRDAAYQRGSAVAEDETQLAQIGYDRQKAAARMFQQLPDNSPVASRVRNGVMQAVQNGDTEAAEALLEQSAQLLTPEQREAVDQYLDTVETQTGVEDAAVMQTEAFETQRREQLQVISDPQGNVTPLLLNDGRTVYYKSGDLDNHYGGVMAVDENGEAVQVSVRQITEVGQPQNVDAILEAETENFYQQTLDRYGALSEGMPLQGQQVDMILSGQPVRAIYNGEDAAGNSIFQLEDGSAITLNPQDAMQAAAEANQAKIQAELKAEADAAVMQQQTQRFESAIKGYKEGQPDLSAAETDAKTAADYIKSQLGADGNDPEKARKQQVADIQNAKEQMEIRRKEAEQELRRMEQWLRGNEDIAEPQEVEDAKQRMTMLQDAIADLTQRQQKWTDIRLGLMSPEERTQMEQQRRRDVFNARRGYKPQLESANVRQNADRLYEDENGNLVLGLTAPGNVNNYLLKNFEDAIEAEKFMNQQRLDLRNQQRDVVQPEINRLNDLLNQYTAGHTDLTTDEIKDIVTQVADLEARQDALSDQAARLRDITEGIPALYERNRPQQQLTPAEQRGKEIDKASSREDKIRIAQNVYGRYPEAADIIADQEPRDLDEFVAANLGLGSMNWEGFDQGERHIIGVQEALFGKNGGTRGIGKQYSTNAFNQYLAPTGEGKGFADIVHDIYESQPDIGDSKRWTTEDISDALLDLLRTAQKPSDISHRIIDNRIAEAEDIVRKQEEYERELEEQAKMEEMQQWADAHHLDPEERETFEEYLKMPPTEPELEVINQIIAENEEKQNTGSEGVDSQHPGGAAGADGEDGQSIVQGQGTGGEAGSNQEQQVIVSGAEAGNGEPPVPDTDVYGGASVKDHLQAIKDGVAKQLEKYRTLAPVEVIDINSDDELRRIAGDDDPELVRKYLKDSKLPAVYDTESKKILIFAENLSEDDVEEAFFHENLHRGLQQYYGDGLIEVAEAFWETESPTNPEATRQRKQAISEGYADKPEDIKEEYLVNAFSHQMTNGTVDNLFPRLSAEHQDIIGNILTNIGYDRSKESAQRKRTDGANPEEDGEDVSSAIQETGSGRGRVDESFPARLARAKAETDVNPTEAQKAAGNYKMGHVRFGGYRISIENPKGSTRSGVDKEGKPWSIDMKDTYGYIGKKYGTDGDHLDFFINDDADLDEFAGRVFIVDQKNEDGTFDEHKVMYGYPTWSRARKAYERNYEPGWWDKHVMQMTGVRKDVFDKWLADSDHKTKPFAEYYRTRMSETVSNPVDQLMADVEERERAAILADIKPWWDEKAIARKTDDELSQLREKARKDIGTANVLLGTTNIEKGSEKEIRLKIHKEQARVNIEAIDKEMERRRKERQDLIESMEAGGAMVDHLQDMGIDVSDDIAENRRVRKQAEKDNSEEGRMRKMTSSDGTVYGFAYRGKLYLDPRKIDANLPLHEYGHLWCEAFRRLNPEGWKEVVDTMKQDADTWKFIKDINPDLKTDDDIAEEMISKGSGENGQQRIMEEFERMSQRDPSYKGKWGNIWKNISKAIQDFWKKVGDFLHIKYESPQQVYDQVLKDFASGVNPRKKVEQYLRQRDEEYMTAVRDGDIAKATQIFNDALKENIGNGMTPFVAVDTYRKLQHIARRIKKGDAAAIDKAAELIAPLIPENAVLIPVPSHEGKATDMLQLARAIAEKTGSEVADILSSTSRKSQYDTKREGGKAMTSDELGITVNGDIPEGKIPVVIDNVVDSGNTAEACIKALGTGIVASLADSANKSTHAATLKSALPIVEDQDGNVIPLSKRFDLGRRYLGKKPDALDWLLDDIDSRREAANDIEGKKEVQAAIESFEEENRRTPAENEVRQRATTATMQMMNYTGVPMKQVSQEEADRMMELFTALNRQEIVNYARSMRPHEMKRYAVINVRDPYAVPKYFEKRKYADEYKVWGNRQGGLFETLDLDRDTEQTEEMRQAADIQPQIDVWHGSGAVFTKFDHSFMGTGQGSQVFGYGTYLTNNKDIGKDYADMSEKVIGHVTHNGKPVVQRSAWDNVKGRVAGFVAGAKGNIEDAKAHIKTEISYAEDEISHFKGKDKKKFANTIERIKGNIRWYNEYLKAIDEGEWGYSETRTPKVLYKVEIPDDTGANYLPWKEAYDNSLPKKLVVKLGEEKYAQWAEEVNRLGYNSKSSVPYSGRNAYKALSKLLGSDEAASKLLNEIGYSGVRFPAGTIRGNGRGATNYVIFNEDDAKIVEYIQFETDSHGKVYGWTDGAAIYLTPLGMNPNSPMHEYTHIWDQYIQKYDQKLWKEMVATLKKTAAWKEVRENPNYRAIWEDENRMASEVHSRLTGARSEEEFMKAAADPNNKDADSIINSVKDVLLRFWERLAQLFGYGRDRLDEFVLMPLKDALNGFDPRTGTNTFDPRAMVREAMIVEMKQKKPIEEAIVKNPNIKEWLDMADRVKTMTGKEALEAYRRINSQMLDENGLNIDEHEAKVKSDYISKHGIKGVGQAMADDLNAQSEKFGFGMISLRWDLLDRIEELGLKDQIENDNIPEGKPTRQIPVRSLMTEGSLFTDADFLPEAKPKKGKKSIAEMSDEELLGKVTKKYSEESRKMLDEYDRRHMDEYEQEKDVYTNMLLDGNTSLDDARDMYDNVFRQFTDTGFASPERTKLNAQISALEDYIEDLEMREEERRLEEEEQAETEKQEDAVLQETDQKQTEAKQKYEQQKQEIRQTGYDLTKLRLRPLEEGETCHVERRYVENGMFSFTGKEKIESIDDVAYIFKELEDAAVENTFLVLEKDDVPTIIHLAIGGYTQSWAEAKPALSAYYELDPEKVYFVHNHPSGNLKASNDDYNVLKAMKKIFGNKLQPGIIIDTKSGKYGLFGDTLPISPMTQNRMPEKTEGEVPLKVYSFSKQVFDADWNPETAFDAGTAVRVAKFVSSHRLGEHKKMSLIVMNQNYNVTGNLFLPWEDFDDVATLRGADLIARYMNQMGGTLVTLYGNYDIATVDQRKISFLNSLLRARGVYLLDVIHIDKSAREMGLVSEPGVNTEAAAKEPENDGQTKVIFDQAKKLFGTTRDIREAGYILPDGSMLDFSGRHHMDPGSDTSFLRGRRTTDHREISSIAYEKDGNTKTGIETDMPDFIKRGAIRIDDNAGSINLAVKPTAKQKTVLRQLTAHNDGYVQVDFGDGWDSDHYVEYDGARPARVLADIDRYFDEGIRPQGDEGLMRRHVTPDIRKANEKFNKDLNTLSDKSVLNLGSPSVPLLASGIENKPLRLYGSKLLAKINKHGYKPEYVRDLPLAVHNPIAIFTGSHPDSFAILTELNIDGNNVLVTLGVGKGGDVDFNIISSVYGKKGNNVLNWINGGKLLYADKEKALDYLHHSTPIVATSESKTDESQDDVLNSAAKIVKDFENPTISDENLRKTYAKYVDAAEETAEMLGGMKVVFESEGSEEGTLGWYDPNNNTIHVVLPEHADADEVKRTVFHEKLGHEGLVGLLGSQDKVNDFGMFVFHAATDKVYQRILEKADEIDPTWSDHQRYSKAAQEVLADIAENGPRTADEFSLWRKIKHYLIKLFHRWGKPIKGLLNDHDLAYYILKTGEALKRWNQMPEEQKAAAARQQTQHEIMRSRRGKPRKRNDESMAQYLQRLREWERWKIAEEQARENNDPMPDAEQINERWHEQFNRDVAEWRRANNIPEGEEGIGEFPRRGQNESPQEYAARVADYETQVDAWKEAPKLFDYLQRANDEYREAYRAWKERYGIQEAESVDLGLYEGDPERMPHIVDPEDLEADMRAEEDLAEAVGIDMSPEGARRHTKISIIERRKNLESANAEDAIWIHDLTRQINYEAKLQGVDPKMLREAMADIIEGTYFEDVIKDEHGNVISIEDISDRLPIKMTDGLKAILDTIKDWYDEFYHVIEDAGLRNDAGYIPEGYVNHVWSKEKSSPEAWKKYVENFQRTKSPNMRERTFETYRMGEDIGLVRKYKDISDILAHYSASNNEAVANRKFLDDLSFIVVEEKNTDGEVVSVLPLLNSNKPNITVSDRYQMYHVPGVGDVWVLKDIQRSFANIFGTMRTGDIPEWLTKTGQVYDTVSSTAKKIELSFSAFHMGALTEVAMAQMRPDRALRALGQYIIFDCAKAGTVPAYAHPEDFKLAASHLVQLGATQDYSAADVNNVTEKIREIVRELAKEENLAKKGAGYAATPIAAALDYINKGLDKVLWNYLHDGLKIACFKMFAEQIDKRVEKQGLSAEQREQLLDEAGQYVNDTFGGQYWELLNVSPALIKWLRRGFLSPDWLISTQRHFLANFGFGSLYSESGFLNYLRYNADNIKRTFGADIPKDENRRFRSKNAKQCYLLGVCGFFYVMMNAINAMFRAWDEDKEREKAEEMRKDNPEYRSAYELAYPDGMKWYDYTMYGNTIGQQTHLFLGRYDDGTEWYARWGKQFREFPELFMGRHGVEFPTPLMERMSGKANPVGRYLLYDLPLTVGMYGYKQPRETQEIAEKYGNTVALLAMTAKKFVPYSVPTQQDKEFKMFDLVMPSQKGFTRWKAVDYFKTYIQGGDMDGVMRTYNAAVMNGIDAEDCLKAAIATVKATQRKELSDGIIDLQSAMNAYDAAKDTAEKKRLRRKIFGYLAEQNYRAFTRDEAREQVNEFLNGTPEADKDINKYVQLATSADVRDEYRLDMIRRQAKKFSDEVKTEENDERRRKLEDTYGNWLEIADIIKDANREIGKLKRQLDKGDDDKAVMDDIREERRNALREIDKIQAP